jgi:hypothetical protein
VTGLHRDRTRRAAAFVPTEEQEAGLDELVRYIPPGLARRYLDDGWAVSVLLGPHAGQKLLASRWVAKGVDDVRSNAADEGRQSH